jgi:sarcosine oxidase
MTSETVYDVAVIGAGMFGSAAGKYLAAAGLQTLIIGASEPQDWQTHDGVFASHYDEARITRIVDPDPYWSELAARSIEQYPVIEKQSGITFHHNVGCLRVAHLKENGESAQRVALQNGADQNAITKVLSSEEAARQFSYFTFPETVDAIWETGQAGYINPRKLVKAQLKIAQNNNATLKRETVQEIIPENNAVKIVTREGQVYYASKVLLAAGAYTKFQLKHSDDLKVHPVQVMLAEVDEPTENIPCLIYSLKNHPILEDIYLLPPVRYPDGKWYLKIGAFPHQLQTANSESDLRKWFQREPADEETVATKIALKELMPNLKVLSYRVVPCVWTYTPQTQPYVKVLLEEDAKGRIGVDTGGCGRGAKSSDAIGKLGAELFL